MEMTVETPKARSSIVPMAIVAMLFFVLGFATWLNGSLMPYLKQMLTALRQVAEVSRLSPDVSEVITKAITANR